MFSFPWSNFHELNLDWILSVVKEAKDIFVKGEGDIQHAVETADQALETAEQAASGVIADGAVTIPKVNGEVLKLFAFVVSGSVNDLPIPKDSFVIVRKSLIAGITDGLYQAVADIPAASVLTSADLSQPPELANGSNNVLYQITSAIESGLLAIVDGDTASAGIPDNGLAFIKNNAHGLATGFYYNSSGNTFPTSGGTADSDTFTRVFDVLNTLMNFIEGVGNNVSDLQAITGDGVLSGFSATDLTGAANELMASLNSLDTEFGTVEGGLAIIVEGNTSTTGASVGQYVYLKNSTITGKTDGLYIAAQAIPANTAIDASYLTAVSGGGLNALQIKIATRTATTDSDGLISLGGTDINSRNIVSVFSDTGTYIYLPLKFSGIWHAKVLGAVSFTPLANTEVTVKYCYFE